MFNDAPLDTTLRDEPSHEGHARFVVLSVLIGVALAVSAAAVAIAIAGSSSSTATTTTFTPGPHGAQGGGAFSLPQPPDQTVPGADGSSSAPQTQSPMPGGSAAAGGGTSRSDIATYTGTCSPGRRREASPSRAPKHSATRCPPARRSTGRQGRSASPVPRCGWSSLRVRRAAI